MSPPDAARAPAATYTVQLQNVAPNLPILKMNVIRARTALPVKTRVKTGAQTTAFDEVQVQAASRGSIARGFCEFTRHGMKATTTIDGANPLCHASTPTLITPEVPLIGDCNAAAKQPLTTQIRPNFLKRWNRRPRPPPCTKQPSPRP